MDRSILGTRIRQRRREIGLTQGALARKAGISASYLNLIEWNKRPIAGTLLHRIAKALNLAPEDLDAPTSRSEQCDPVALGLHAIRGRVELRRCEPRRPRPGAR